MGSNWEEFYANLPKPKDLDQSIKLLEKFSERAQSAKGIVLVTVSLIHCLIDMQ